MSSSRSRDQHEDGRQTARAARDLAAANTFYTDLLRGRLVHHARRRTDGAHLWFRVDDVLVQTGPGADGGAPVLLHVDDPLALAERCWDAGFTVRLLDPPFGHATVSVMDPFGRQLSLAPAAYRDPRQAANGA